MEKTPINWQEVVLSRKYPDSQPKPEPEKVAQRTRLEDDIREYLLNGGTIQEIDRHIAKNPPPLTRRLKNKASWEQARAMEIRRAEKKQL